MAEIKFGWRQIINPTPAILNRGVRVATVIIAIFMAWMATASIVGPNTKNIWTQILGLILALINGIAPLFGIPLKDEPVPAKDVASVESK